MSSVVAIPFFGWRWSLSLGGVFLTRDVSKPEMRTACSPKCVRRQQSGRRFGGGGAPAWPGLCDGFLGGRGGSPSHRARPASSQSALSA